MVMPMEVAVVGERCLLAGGCRWLVPSLNLRRRLRRTCAPHVCPAHLPLRPCRKCGGEGTTVKNPCKKCSGAGRVRTTKTVQVVVPPGIDSGISMRLSGQGDAGERGGPAGHLFVQVRATALRCPSRPVPSHRAASASSFCHHRCFHRWPHHHDGDHHHHHHHHDCHWLQVRVEPDPFFERDGSDIHVTVPITIAQAVLGAVVTVPTIRGEVELKIPKGESRVTGHATSHESQCHPCATSRAPPPRSPSPLLRCCCLTTTRGLQAPSPRTGC